MVLAGVWQTDWLYFCTKCRTQFYSKIRFITCNEPFVNMSGLQSCSIENRDIVVISGEFSVLRVFSLAADRVAVVRGMSSAVESGIILRVVSRQARLGGGINMF